MDVERTRKLLANPASTRQELEQLLKQALAANQRELAFDIKDAIEERFPVAAAVNRGATETMATFGPDARRFATAKEAYIWLVERFIGVKPEVFTDIRRETTGYVALGRRKKEGKSIRNYFARSPQALFRNTPRLAEDHNNSVQLQNGWFANTNLNNREKFEALVRFGWLVGLRCGKDWDWEVLDPSDALRESKQRMAIADELFIELQGLDKEQ